MNLETFKSILTIGETIAVEFKRCGNGIEHDSFENVCAFLNRFGGDIFRIIVPLDDEYSFDYGFNGETTGKTEFTTGKTTQKNYRKNYR